MLLCPLSLGKEGLLADLGDLVALLSRALGLAGGVAQGKDDRALVEGGHVPQNLLREGSCDGSDTYREKVGSGDAYSLQTTHFSPGGNGGGTRCDMKDLGVCHRDRGSRGEKGLPA